MRLVTGLSFLILLASTPVFGQRSDSAAFIIRLGDDTTAIERYVRTGNQLIAEAVQRSPSTTVHRLVLDLTPAGGVRRAVRTVSRPGTDANAVQQTFTFDGDSATVVTNQGGTPTIRRVVARNAIPIAGPFFSPYELAVMRASAGKAPLTRVHLLTASDTVGIPVQRVGRDSVALTNQFGEPMRAHVDAAGRILHLHTPAFTTVERTRWVDLEGLTRDFAARDATGRGLGPLSPREASRTGVAGANIWIDYSRPGKRGRPVWGALVPYGEVWRTGANEAAHFATDRTIELGSLTLAPGTYTLFLLPGAAGWSLIVNRGTGMSGLARDPAQDVGTVGLELQTLERPAELFTIDVQEVNGQGRLAFAWDRTRAVVPFAVK